MTFDPRPDSIKSVDEITPIFRSIMEPSTMITDYILFAVNLILGARIWRSGRGAASTGPVISQRLWSGAFIAVAIAALTGGSYHGFFPSLGDTPKTILWKVTVYSVGVASFLMLAGSLMATMKSPIRRRLIAAGIAKLVFYSFWMIHHTAYRYVIYDYLPAMAAVFVLHSIAGDESARWIFWGIGVSILGAACQMLTILPHPHFNHNDLYHVIQIGANFLFYQGARRMKDA